MNLAGWDLEISFMDETHPDDDPCQITAADINILHEYQSAKIRIRPLVKEYFDEDRIDKIVGVLVHELCHILTDPFLKFVEPHLSGVTQPFFSRILESETQKISSIIVKSLPKNTIPPR